MENVALTTRTQKLLIAVASLSYLVAGIGFILVPLLIAVFNRSDELVHFYAKQAAVCHVVLVVVYFVLFAICAIVKIPILGEALIAIVAAFYVVVAIKATIEGCKGNYYKYPIVSKLV